MMETIYVTADQMRKIDETAIKKYGIPAARLMENAGSVVAAEAMKVVDKGNVVIFSGYGNNGGDGFVAGRRLIKNGFDNRVFLVGVSKAFSPETQSNYDALIKLRCNPEKISTVKDIDKIFSNLKRPDLIIDAIFGIGIRGILENFYIKLIYKINSINSPIIAVDIPSGLDSNTGEPLPVAIKASKTVTLGFPKVGFKNPNAKVYVGELVVADIGLPAVDT